MTEETLHMLLVDDDLELLEAMARNLGRRGFHVTIADDGARALELLASSSFDVMVVDMLMPGIDGAALFRRTKKLEAPLPVIMLTGHGDIKEAYELSREGVFEYLTKPCSADKLAKVARRAHAASRARTAKEPLRVLIIDEDLTTIEPLIPELALRGFEVTCVRTEELGLAHAAKSPVDVALIAIDHVTMRAGEQVARMKAARPGVEVILLTEQPSVRQAIDGLSSGAFDLTVKPLRLEALVLQLHRAGAAAHARGTTTAKDK